MKLKMNVYLGICILPFPPWVRRDQTWREKWRRNEDGGYGEKWIEERVKKEWERRRRREGPIRLERVARYKVRATTLNFLAVVGVIFVLYRWTIKLKDCHMGREIICWLYGQEISTVLVTYERLDQGGPYTSNWGPFYPMTHGSVCRLRQVEKLVSSLGDDLIFKRYMFTNYVSL